MKDIYNVFLWSLCSKHFDNIMPLQFHKSVEKMTTRVLFTARYVEVREIENVIPGHTVQIRLWSPSVCEERDGTCHLLHYNHSVVFSPNSVLRNWSPWRMAQAAMITPRASTALMALMEGVSSFACNRHCLCPMMPPPAPSSCSAGESPSLRSRNSHRAAGIPWTNAQEILADQARADRLGHGLLLLLIHTLLGMQKKNG